MVQAWHTDASSPAYSDPSDGDTDPSGWVRLSLKLGYFRFCYSYKLHFDPVVTPSYNASAQDASISGCQTIAHKCEFNLVSPKRAGGRCEKGGCMPAARSDGTHPLRVGGAGLFSHVELHGAPCGAPQRELHSRARMCVVARAGYGR